MPMPKPGAKEDQKTFVARFMADETMRREYPDEKQRAAVAYSQWRRRRKEKLAKTIERADETVRKAAKELRDLAGLNWIAKDDEPPKSDGRFELTCQLCKVEDADQFTFVWGPVLVPEKVDKQGDTISAPEIEDAAHSFLEDSGRPGLLHRVMLGSRDATIVESSILRASYKVSKSQTLPVGTWMIGMRVYNQKVRDLIIGGELQGFSIGGQGLGIEE